MARRWLDAASRWWLHRIHGVGERVYWNNTVHPWYSGVYVITSKEDPRGYIRIQNEKCGSRIVPRYYVEPYDPKTHNADRSVEH